MDGPDHIATPSLSGERALVAIKADLQAESDVWLKSRHVALEVKVSSEAIQM